MKTRVLPVLLVLGAAGVAGVWWYGSGPLRTPPAQEGDVERMLLEKPDVVRLAGARDVSSGMPDARKLTPQVRALVDRSLTTAERRAAVAGLPVDPGPDDVKALQAFLRTPNAQDGTPIEQALKNDFMDWLCEQDVPGLRETLVRVHEDRHQDPVLRDYALQHLAEYYQRLAEDGAVRTPDSELAEVARVLWRAVEETDSSIAGTALLGLSRLSVLQPEFDRERVLTTASQLAGERAASSYTRTAAIQVCAQMGATDAVPVIRETAQWGETVALQASAIAALGNLGGTDAIPWLTELANGPAEPVKPAARQALRQIALLEEQKVMALRAEREREEGERLRREKAARRNAVTQ